MKKREIFLVVALVVFGVIYQAVEKGKVRFAENFSFYTDERRLKGSRFAEFPGQETQVPGVERVVIENPAGEITVDRSIDGQVHLASLLRVYYSDKSIVDSLPKNAEVRRDLSGGTLKISVRYPGAFPYRHLRVLFRLQVPLDVPLTIINHEGDVIVRDTGKDLRIDQMNGGLVLENIPARVQLHLKNCVAKIKGLTDHAEITASQANVYLEDAVSLQLNGRHGECSIRNVKNDVRVEYAYGRLRIDGAGRLEIAARHSDIRASRIKDGAVIANKFEGIFLENAGGDIRLSNRSGRIELSHSQARNVVIENAYADIKLEEFSGASLDVLLKNGNLDLQVVSVSDRVNVEAEHAELQLAFAALADPTFSIKTRQGRIYAQPILGLESFEENSESFANRSGQKPEILIHNTYGNVRVKIAD
jgi:DUF4097 and DUF4098 domain-containing protein YvlB